VVVGSIFGYGPEVGEKKSSRHVVIRCQWAMTSTGPSASSFAKMLVDLLNHRITPVVLSRGTLGEGELAQLEQWSVRPCGSRYA